MGVSVRLGKRRQPSTIKQGKNREDNSRSKEGGGQKHRRPDVVPYVECTWWLIGVRKWFVEKMLVTAQNVNSL